MRTIKKIGRVVQCDIDMWVPGATTLTLARGTIIFDSFGQVGTIKISDIDLAACDPVITDGTDEEIFNQVVDFFAVSHGGSIQVSVEGVEVATTSENIDLGLVNSDGQPLSFTVDGVNISVTRSGIIYASLDPPMQSKVYQANDYGTKVLARAYRYIPRHSFSVVQEIDYTTDYTGKTLLYNNALGNKHRFTDASGNPGPFSYATSNNSESKSMLVFIDHYTNTGYAFCDTQQTMDNYLASCAAITIASKTGWVPCGSSEFLMLCNFNGDANDCLAVDLGASASNAYRSGMTRASLTTSSLTLSTTIPFISTAGTAKSTIQRTIYIKPNFL